MLKALLCLRYSRELREFGDAIWALRCEIESTPKGNLIRQQSIQKRRDEILRELITDSRLQRVQQYLFRAHGLPLHEPLLPREEAESQSPIAAICPRCGSTEMLDVHVGLWDGIDEKGNDAHGISMRGHCRKCGDKLAYFGEDSTSGIGKEWQKVP